MTEDLPLFKKQGQIRQPKQYSKREELAVVLSVLADFCHSMLDQIESLQAELSGVKDRVKDFENLNAENENLRDKLTGWLQKPDDCSEDCCSIADSLEHLNTTIQTRNTEAANMCDRGAIYSVITAP